jgi:hypothetical protein
MKRSRKSVVAGAAACRSRAAAIVLRVFGVPLLCIGKPGAQRAECRERPQINAQVPEEQIDP